MRRLFIVVLLCYCVVVSGEPQKLCPIFQSCVSSKWGRLGIFADYLHWKARENGLAYAITGLKTSSNTPPETRGEAKNLNWKWNQGYRIGVDYTLPCFCWNVGVSYTKFKSSASAFTYVPLNGFGQATLWEVWGAPSGGTFITDAGAEWVLNFQTIDILAGRSFFVGQCFIFRPFGGLEIARTKDFYDINYSHEGLPFFQIIHNRQHFYGCGPKIGIDNNWHVASCFSLFAEGSVALVYGQFKLERQDVVQTSEGNAAVWVNTGDHFAGLRPLLNLRVGARWDTCLCERAHVFIKLALEDLVFIGHNQFMRFTEGDINIVSDTNIGNFWNVNSSLSFFGVTLSAGLDF